MKKYHEFGVTKENGKITGFFLKEGGVAVAGRPFFVSYQQFIELVKQGEVQQFYWNDSTDSIGVNVKEDVGQGKVARWVRKAMKKVPEIKDFEEFLKRDVVFDYHWEHGVVPAAVLKITKTMLMNMITILMPYTEEVEQMHQKIERELPECKGLFGLRAGGLTLTVTVNLLEEVLTRVKGLGYPILLCMETVKNLAGKQISKEVMKQLESIVVRWNYKIAQEIFHQGTMKKLNVF